MKLVTKSVEATIEPVADADAESPDGEFNVILATPGADREGDDLEGKGWQLPLPEHITFDTDHGMSVQTLAGSGAPTLEADGSIRVKGTYADTEHGQNTRKLVNKRHIRTVSVTYLQRTTKSAGKTTVSRELLNGSFVAVPANPKAVILSSKGLTTADDETETYRRDGAAPQSIHDLAVALGAGCSHAKNLGADDDDDAPVTAVTIVAKGIAGSVEELGDRVRKAVRDQHKSDRAYPYVRATFLNDGGSGTVVYDLESYGDMSSTSKTLARDFTLDGSKVALDATPREVSLVTSVVDTEDTAGAVGTKSMATDDQSERAIALLMKSTAQMTREAACELLGIDDGGANVATEATAEDDTAEAAAGKPAAADADDTDAAASPAELRARALLLSIPDAAG